MGNIQEIVKFCKVNWKNECEHIIKNAERVCENRFLFDMPWDMEQTNEEVYLSEIDWDFKPKTDPEWTFMLARNGFILHLAKAYALTGSPVFLEKLLSLINDFIDNAPLTVDSAKTSWRSLDCGIRIENWIKAYEIITALGFSKAEFTDKVTTSIAIHAQYLFNTDTVFTKLSNWGIIGNSGLFCAGVFLSDERYIKAALTRLDESATIQVLPDGVHWEQSPMYHNEVLAALMQVMLTAQQYSIDIPDGIKNAVKSMTYANLYWAKPNHHQFMQSDSDDTSLQGIITRGSYLLSDKTLKYGGFSNVDFDTAWSISAGDIERFGKIEPTVPPKVSCSMQSSGNYYLRSSWEADATLLHFRCGAVGSGHGHADMLHFDLVFNGEDILVDSGRYCYEECDDRLLLKRPQMHNTLTIDDVDFSVCTSSWGFEKKAMAVKRDMYENGNIKFVEGSHLGYMDEESPVFVSRKIIMLDENVTIVADFLCTSGQHNYNQYFHFDNAGMVTLQGNATYETDKIVANLYFLNDDTATSQNTTPYSKHYNSLEEKTTVTAKTIASGSTMLMTVIVAFDKAKKQELAVEKVELFSAKTGKKLFDSQACGVKITSATGENRIVVIVQDDWIDGVDLIDAQGTLVYGNIILCREEGGKKEITIID